MIMSALATYYEAMANDRNAAAALSQAQANQVGLNAESDRQYKSETGSAAQTNANAAMTGATSEANERNASADATRAGIPFIGMSKSAEAGLQNAQAAGLNAATPFIGQEKLAGIDATRAQTGLTTANTSQVQYGLSPNGLQAGSALAMALRNSGYGLGMPTLGTPITSSPSVLDNPGMPVTAQPGTQYRSKGGMVGPGQPKGKPNAEDTQPTMLAPGEAVLNRGAAEHLGGDVVDHLNKLGAMRMAAQDEVAAHVKALRGHSLTKIAKAAQPKTSAGQGRSKSATPAGRAASNKAA